MDGILDKIIIPGLTFLSITSIGGSILLSKMSKRKALEDRLREGALTGTDTKASREDKSGLLQFLEKIGNLASHGKASTNLWEQLFRAGYYNKAAPAMYTGIKMLLFVFGLVGTAILVVPMEVHITTKITYIFLGGILLFFIPNVILLIRLSPILAGAMALTNFEIHLGVSRVEAMRHMADRTGVEKLSSLSAVLVQTERFGTSIATTLKVFAESMREERFFTAEEQAEKIAVKLIVPMVLFIFPTVFIVSAGPAVVAIADMIRTY
jgi:Flp pilus assembly protein TadB